MSPFLETTVHIGGSTGALLLRPKIWQNCMLASPQRVGPILRGILDPLLVLFENCMSEPKQCDDTMKIKLSCTIVISFFLWVIQAFKHFAFLIYFVQFIVNLFLASFNKIFRQNNCVNKKAMDVRFSSCTKLFWNIVSCSV